MGTRSFISVITLFVLVTTSLQAGVVPGRWQKVDALQPGKEIVVTLKSGDHIEGTFKSSGPEELTWIDPNGREQMVPRSEVRKIVSVEKIKDRLRNGVLIELGVGSGVGLFGYSIAEQVAGGEGAFNEYSLSFALLGAGIGALVGMTVDAVRQETEVLYQAP